MAARRFPDQVNWSGSLQAFPLWIATGFGNGVTVVTAFLVMFQFQHEYETLFAYLTAHGPHFKPHSVDVSWTVLFVSMILNAFFEELTCTGYMFNQFAAKRGPGIALLLTVLVRMSCHVYQGVEHMLGIGVVFTIFGLWYWRTRNLWTLVLAHILIDLGAGIFVKLMYG